MIRGGKTLTISPHNISIYSPRVVAAANWWLAAGIPSANCVGAYDAENAASLAASYINLANTGDLTAVTPPAHAQDTGWTFVAASNQYLITPFIPASTTSVIVRFASVPEASDGNLFGFYNTNRRFEIRPWRSGVPNNILYGYGSGYNTVSPQLATGVLALAGPTGYRDGVLDSSSIGTWSGSASTTILIGARRREDVSSIDNYLSVVIKQIAFYDILIDSYVAALTAAMNAL